MFRNDLGWCRISTALVIVLLIGSGCSLFESDSSAADPTDDQLRRVANEVPAFGGVVFEEDQLVVFTRGDDLQAASDALRDIFGVQAAAIDLRSRPPEGPITEDRLEASRSAVQQNESVEGTGFANGYMVVYVHTAEAVLQAQQAVETSKLSLDEVAIRVTSSFVASPGR